MSRGKIDPIFALAFKTRISSAFLTRFATCRHRVCQSMLLVCPCHGVSRHARLIGFPGVAGDLVEAFVPADGGDLIGRASRLSKAPAGSLT
jgi:hypothetical protein